MNVTIRDVARMAGVSVATVSRVLNASAVVHPDTRARVLAAASALQFAPNAAARSLSSRRTHALGVVLPDLYGEFFSELLRGMDQTAQARGHHLLVSSSHHEAEGLAAAMRAMRGRVDGIIVMAPEIGPEALAQVLPDGLPIVAINATAPQANVHSVLVDNFGGARAMTRHLATLGHRRIGFVAGAARNADAAERERGYRAGLKEARLRYDPTLRVRGDFTEEGGFASARVLLALADSPTAIFAANDAMAVGVLSAVRTAGIAVPGAIAVVGFDDIPIARFLSPPLTTIRVGIAELGARATELLLGALAEPGTVPQRREMQPTRLAVRDSCRPAPGPRPPPRLARAPAVSA